jgi:hypothetical protein
MLDYFCHVNNGHSPSKSSVYSINFWWTCSGTHCLYTLRPKGILNGSRTMTARYTPLFILCFVARQGWLFNDNYSIGTPTLGAIALVAWGSKENQKCPQSRWMVSWPEY